MTRRRLMPVLAALLIWGNLNSACGAAVVPPEATLPKTPSSPSGVIIDEAGARKSTGSSGGSSESWEKPRGRDPPGSPVKLFMPDEFQFYTLNNNGQLVMKQMTKQEIQGMIAGGGAGNNQVPVDLGHHQLQTHMSDGVPKVSDVVQNVQKVLKAELSKPVPVHTSGTSIPGSVNSQWTNMLPYILSGGSVDQQDVAQDASVLFSDSENPDQSYVDVVPLQSGKPTDGQSYEPETNYVQQVQPVYNNDEVKVVTIKTTSGTSSKPILMLGNMGLDTGILDGEQEIYTPPPKSKPGRPTTSSSYKFTTTKSPLTSTTKNSFKNQSGGKPTLYIPSSIGNTQNQGNFVSSYHEIPEANKNSQTDDQSSAEQDYVQASSTEQSSSSSESPATISIISTTIKEGPFPSKINVGPIGGFKIPESNYKPAIVYRPLYEPINKFTTAGLPSSTSRRPAYTTSSKPASPTYRPIYEPSTRPSTQKFSHVTHQHPVYQPSTRPSTATTGGASSSYRPINEEESKPSFPNPESIQSIYEILTKPNEGMIVTRYPADTYSTGKASSPMMEFVTQPSTESELLKVTKYPSSQVYTTGKSTSVIELVTKSSTQKSDSKVTTNSLTEYNTTKVSTPVYTSEQATTIQNKPKLSLASQVKENTKIGITESTLLKEPFLTSTIKNLESSAPEKISYKNKVNTDSVISTKMEIENSTASYNAEKSTQKIEDQTVKVKNISALEISTSQPSASQSEESSTDINDYHTFISQEETTNNLEILSTQTESTILKVSESHNDLKKENESLKSAVSNEPTEKFSSTSKPLELTTQEIFMGEGTTEYYTVSYNLENTEENKNEPNLPVKSSVEGLETTYAPYEENDKTESDDSAMYTTPSIISIEEDKKSISDSKIAKPTNDTSSTKVSLNDIEIIKKDTKKTISENINKNDTLTISKDQTVTEKNKPSTLTPSQKNQTFSNIKIIPYSSQLADLIKDNNKSDIPSYENKILELMGNYESKLTPGSSEKLNLMPSSEVLSNEKAQEQPDKNVLKNQVTLSYEKTESVTENTSMSEEKIDLNKISLPESEISTVKVIPIYDDDTSIYTVPFENPNKITSTIPSDLETKNKIESSSSTAKYTETMSSESQISNESTQTIKSTSERESFTPVTSTSSYTSQSDLVADVSLPGLQETFNNYMKEHYDSNLFTTDIYDEISGLTTFPPVIYKGLSMNKNKVTTDYSPFEDSTETESPNYVINEQNLDEDSTENVPENFSDLKLDYATQNSAIKEFETVTTETPEIKETVSPTRFEINETTRMETPIIYLDLTSPDPIIQSASQHHINDHISNSSFTRIKVKNPVLDIDKIISDAQAQSITASTEAYTLPTEPKPANNIASGIIAGYSTYHEGKPIAEYTVNSAEKKDNIKNGLPIVKNDVENLSKEQNIIKVIEADSEKMTTLYLQTEKYEDKPTTKSAYNTEDVETSTYEFNTSEIPNFEFNTHIPLDSKPIGNKFESSSQNDKKVNQINENFNPPLEKLSDLINQLQSSPSQHDSIGYDYSNGVATTIVPLDKFGMLMNESNTLTNDQTFSTLYDDVTKSLVDSKNNTYVVLQTLPYKQTTKIYEETTLPTILSTTEKKNKIETTPGSINTESNSDATTTILSIVKQPVTGKPFVTTTYSTTKGSIEKIQSTIDKSAGRINLEDEKTTKLPSIKPTEPSKFTIKNKGHYNPAKRPVSEGYQGYTRKATRPALSKTTQAPISNSTNITPILITTKESLTTKTVEEIKDSTEKLSTTSQKNIPEPVSKEGSQILNPQPVNSEPEVKKFPATSKEGVQHLNPQIVSLDHSSGAIGLDQSNSGLDKDVAEFLNMCNELSFRFWTFANSGLSSSRSVTLSPFGMISTLAMIFLGARGLTSNQMNDILKLDDVVTFNPHLVFQNITDTVTLARGQGIENAAFVRALFADRLKVRRIIPFYKEQAQQFYEGAVVDINFSTAGDILRRRTNLLIRKQTGGRIKDFMKTHTVPLRSPLTALSANVFQTSCDSPDASSEGRDGEMYFAVSQTVKQRKLVPIPAVVWKSGVSAGYEPSLDATAVALGDSKRPVSFIMIMPGQQGLTAPGDNLERLENRLFTNPSDNPLDKLLKVIIPRRVEVQMPKFSHRSVINVTSALKKMGFEQLFTKTADLKGINGAGHDLYLADMLQMNLFCTCGGENKLGGRPLSETYPGTVSRHTRAWETINNFNNKANDGLENNKSENLEASESIKCDEVDDWSSSDPMSEANGYEVINQDLDKFNTFNKRFSRFMQSKRRRCRTRRQTEPEKPRMKMDKPFLYLIRHNLTGLILHIGRFNPKNQS